MSEKDERYYLLSYLKSVHLPTKINLDKIFKMKKLTCALNLAPSSRLCLESSLKSSSVKLEKKIQCQT